MPGGSVVSRELRDDERRIRAAGMDWPLQGLTMAGLPRLDDLQACVERVVADGVPGDLIEAALLDCGGSSECDRGTTTAPWSATAGAPNERTHLPCLKP